MEKQVHTYQDVDPKGREKQNIKKADLKVGLG